MEAINASVSLEFHREHKSIDHLDNVTLPQFVVLTGKNGSGKSHLLEAINNGAIKTNVTNDPRRETRIFTWNSIVPDSSGSYSLGDWSAAVESVIKSIESHRDAALTNARNNLEASGGDASLLSSLSDVLAIATAIAKNKARPDEIAAMNAFRNSVGQYKNGFISAGRDQQLISKQAMSSLWQKDQMIFALGSRSEIREILADHQENNIEIFQQAFSRIFVEYLKKWQENQLAEINSQSFLTKDDFIKKHHIAPWDFVNNILEKSRLPFRINRPKAVKINEPYEPKLVKSNGAEMRFDDLSSGEKVLMSFAFCIYNAFGEDSVFPKILLLDEVDAPLHPEMVDVVLNVINETLVEGSGINVIMSTHKPTTVALAPEESIYEIVESRKINKVSREKAVSILTVGVPTMAFTTDLRQQVITEAEIDAAALSAFYQIYKSELSSDKSLVFLQSGRRTPAGAQDSGCSRVIDLVSRLKSNGVRTVSGIIDWDGKNKPTESVLVLCENNRYSLENLILDPLIIVTLLVRDFKATALDVGIISERENYVELLGWDNDRWQMEVSKLSADLFGKEFEKASVIYKNGMRLDVAKQALVMRGHDFREKLDNHWGGKLKKYQGDKLLVHICEVILPEIKSIAPIEMYSTMESLLQSVEG